MSKKSKNEGPSPTPLPDKNNLENLSEKEIKRAFESLVKRKFSKEQTEQANNYKELDRILKEYMECCIIMGYDGKNSDKSLDQVMMSFINAMVRKDKNTVLSFFSERIPFKWVYYEIATTKPLYVNYFYYKDLANDFKNEKGHYNHFLMSPTITLISLTLTEMLCGRKREKIPLFTRNLILEQPT